MKHLRKDIDRAFTLIPLIVFGASFLGFKYTIVTLLFAIVYYLHVIARILLERNDDHERTEKQIW